MEPPALFDDLERRFRRLPADHETQQDLSAGVFFGVWTIAYGQDGTDAFLDEFRDLATQAAIGGDLVVGDEDPGDVWLNRLRQGPHFHTIDGSATDGEVTRASDGGYIDFLCLASEKCCVKLKTLALQKRDLADEGASEEPRAPEAVAADKSDRRPGR